MKLHLKSTTVFILILFLLGGQLACRLSQGNGNTTHLTQALRYVPSSTPWVFFTDWELIKSYESMEKLTSQANQDERFKLMQATVKSQAAASCYACEYFPKFAETWKWDSADLIWEATANMAGLPPFHVLKFRDDFDFEPVLALFDERGFTKSDYQGTPIYSHELDASAEWLRTGAISIINTAVLKSEKILILSGQIDSVQAALDVYKNKADAMAEDKNVKATVKSLGTNASAIIVSGSTACLRPDEILLKDITTDQKEQLQQMLGLNEPLTQQPHAFVVLGVGYRYEQQTLVGLIVMHYDNPDLAKADLDRRQQIAEEGASLLTNRLYRESVFTIEKAYVDQADLILQVRPVDDMPRRLFQMVNARDMLFAVCPP